MRTQIETPAPGAPRPLVLHASAAARDGAGVLLLGPPGAGKSDLVLRLLHHGFTLIADDQVHIEGLVASPPPSLAGLLEVRGLGVVRLPFTTAPLLLAVKLGPPPRLPAPEIYRNLDIPMVTLDPFAASAPLQIALALDCAQGKLTTVAGAFE